MFFRLAVTLILCCDILPARPADLIRDALPQLSVSYGLTSRALVSILVPPVEVPCVYLTHEVLTRCTDFYTECSSLKVPQCTQQSFQACSVKLMVVEAYLMDPLHDLVTDRALHAVDRATSSACSYAYAVCVHVYLYPHGSRPLSTCSNNAHNHLTL